MRKYLLCASACLALGAAPVYAADLAAPRPLEPVILPPVFSWTGFYIGPMLGYGWGTGKSKPTCGKDGFCKKIKPDGFIGGIFAGYNFQTHSHVVLGADADFLWGNIKGTGDEKCGGCVGDNKGNFNKLRLKEEWVGGARGRLGYAFDRVMPYLAGGVSYAKLQGSYREKGAAKYTKGKNKTVTGWNAGVGVDFIPPVMHDHIVLRAEYRYSDFGKKNYKFTNDKTYRVQYNENDFRVGVAYKF